MSERWQWAVDLASTHLSSMGDRWTHTQAVGQTALTVSLTVSDPSDVAALIAAAWLHDIGYAPDVADSGFHPPDGARCLQRQGVALRIVNLVANHSCARFEAHERHLLGATPLGHEASARCRPPASSVVGVD